MFEGSLAKQRCVFWASKFHLWRESNRKALFYRFKASFSKESRRKASFLNFKASFLKEVVEKFRFWASKFHFWRKLAEKLRFWAYTTKRKQQQYHRHSCKPVWYYSTCNGSTSVLWWGWQYQSQDDGLLPNHLNLKPIDNQTTWIPTHLNPRFLMVGNFR